MSISLLDTSGVRNLTDTRLLPSPRFNLVYGNNGSGKTSLLETIFLLAHGRSFRTNHIKRVITHEKESFSLFCKLASDESTHAIGLERTLKGEQRLRHNGASCSSVSVFTRLLPVLLLNPDAFRLLEDGPTERRQFIDWGVFHVEHEFFSLWQRWRRTLLQRNAALKMGAGVSAWDAEFISLSLQIDSKRRHYLQLFTPVLMELLGSFLSTYPINLKYKQGWPKDKSLPDALAVVRDLERQRGFTMLGPQRADLSIEINGLPAVDILSRGQQKLLVSAAKLAQGMVLDQISKKESIYLIDDLASELDHKYLQQISQILRQLGSQIFVTGIRQDDLWWASDIEDKAVFHVKHGVIMSELERV